MIENATFVAWFLFGAVLYGMAWTSSFRKEAQSYDD